MSAPDVGTEATPPVAPIGKDAGSTSASMSESFQSAKTAASNAVKQPSSGLLDKLPGSQSAFKEQVLELQRWDQPFNSAIVVAAVTFVFVMTWGEEAYSAVNLLCYLVMIRLVVIAACHYALEATKGPEKVRSLHNALRSLCDGLEKWLPIPAPKQVSSIIGGSASLIEAKINGACKSLDEATKPTSSGRHALKIVLAHLVVTIIVFKIFTVYTVMYLAFMHQMIWPALYQRNQEKIDEVSDAAWSKVEPHVEQAKAKAQEAYAKAEQVVSEKVSQVKEKMQQKTAKTDQPATNKTD
ncbi:Hypothetical Protein FCC1311_079682 [Hondaea fermentalgiana]|uniref:Reticulon domain-containing protein n=1 Tax=Hondaea fermentalgiana TaxID=2315210 RepID=A0A2R5GSW6_9STRA|nr:Hypothetical Protein FCC1311_079682 [Hondaea fermentalgiana]|eukprot:GBG31743.1 Hypothetical Protein FCC1311_079682 [Hondaea fermentalgiana]